MRWFRILGHLVCVCWGGGEQKHPARWINDIEIVLLLPLIIKKGFLYSKHRREKKKASIINSLAREKKIERDLPQKNRDKQVGHGSLAMAANSPWFPTGCVNNWNTKNSALVPPNTHIFIICMQLTAACPYPLPPNPDQSSPPRTVVASIPAESANGTLVPFVPDERLCTS